MTFHWMSVNRNAAMKRKRSLRKFATTLAIAALLGSTSVRAGDGMSGMAGMSGGGAAFLVDRAVDGYDVKFHVMAAPEGRMKSGDHNFMIQVTQNGRPVPSLLVNSKVIGPDGRARSHPMTAMGDWFMASYDMATEGRYQLLILFKTPDGKKHKAGVYYPK